MKATFLEVNDNRDCFRHVHESLANGALRNPGAPRPKCAVKQLFIGIRITMVVVVALCLILIPAGCSPTNGEGFAIYLTQGDVPPSQMSALSHVDLAERPLIGMADVITYNAQTHELKLTASASESISQLDVPVRGKSFVVCVDRKQIYSGAFWTPISSMSFDGVTIWKQLGADVTHIITLELGYPSSSFYEGEDPRNHPEITRSLEKAGKLISRLSISAVPELPHSVKGYELYSWSQDSRWNFTLITGTNRDKTLEEVTTGEDFISETGWERIRVSGTDALKTVLSKLPQNESVVWLSGLRDGSTQTGIDIQLPPAPTIGAIEAYAEQHGLDFHVQ